MATTFEHEIEAVDGLSVRFTSKKVHPDAGIAWPWHHAMLSIGTIQPMDTNPIATDLGDGLFEDEVLRARHPEVYAEVEQTEKSKKQWVTTVRFTDAKWIPPAVVPGFRWTSGA